jgi:non-homologous end joining protein Ku
MAARANWKGFLKLSLVTCPVALFPAKSETEKATFNQINKQTGHRIKYTKVDAETGDEVPSEDIIKGYKVDTDTYVTVDREELENIALESTRTIDIDEFVPRSEIDELYLVRPYYIVPDGKAGHDAYAVLEEGKEIMDEYAETSALDAGLLAAAQTVEHYEISRYGTLKSWAAKLGMVDAVRLLDQTLSEEKKTDEALIRLAGSEVNAEAA